MVYLASTTDGETDCGGACQVFFRLHFAAIIATILASYFVLPMSVFQAYSYLGQLLIKIQGGSGRLLLEIRSFVPPRKSQRPNDQAK